MGPAPVSLRGVADGDVALFFDHQADPQAAGMAAFRSRDEEAHAQHWERIRADGSVIVRTVVAGDKVVGNIVSWLKEDRRAVGYWIGRAYWGRGFATSALEQFLKEVPERPLYAFVATSNLGSLRVLEKCGFTIVPGTESPASSSDSRSEDGVEELVLQLDR